MSEEADILAHTAPRLTVIDNTDATHITILEDRLQNCLTRSLRQYDIDAPVFRESIDWVSMASVLGACLGLLAANVGFFGLPTAAWDSVFIIGVLFYSAWVARTVFERRKRGKPATVSSIMKDIRGQRERNPTRRFETVSLQATITSDADMHSTPTVASHPPKTTEK